MNIKIFLVLVTLLVFAGSVQAGLSNDKTCIQGWLIPGVLPLYICYNSDGGMDHSFLTYESMNSYYSPLVETYIPEEIYVYGGPTETLTISKI